MPTAAESNPEFSMSKLSLNSSGSHSEDWDKSESDIQVNGAGSSTVAQESSEPNHAQHTPRNSVIISGGDPSTPAGKRSLSELLRLHAEKGTACTFTAEEAARLADVLGEWINSGPSPYEDEDNFFLEKGDASKPTAAATAS